MLYKLVDTTLKPLDVPAAPPSINNQLKLEPPNNPFVESEVTALDTVIDVFSSILVV